MLYCKMISGIILTLAALLQYVASQHPSLAELGQAVREVLGSKNNRYVCDETDNTGNWFIYCSGELLAAVNIHKLETDWKTFVDRPMKSDPKKIKEEFEKKFGKQKVENINPQELLAFRDLHFDIAGTELEDCEPTGWQPKPPKIARIKDDELREFALFLNKRWKLLCRRIKKIENAERNSLIYVPEEFIIPGGRFREYYYWDAYWIVKGLIVSGLTENVKKMITNFIHCVKKFGFVPNGGRVYYLRRSQPPFLLPMAYEYYEATNDVRFIEDNYEYLMREFDFWQVNRSMKVKGMDGKEHTVYLYRTVSNVPRPESYGADIISALKVPPVERQQFFQDIASTAESGWDFSSRWFKDRQTLQTVETTKILPVDLNALLCWNANILKYFANVIGNETSASKYERIQFNIAQSLRAIFYNYSENTWFDYNMRTKSHNTLFYPSVAMPLFAGCFSELNHEKAKKIVDFMKRTGAFDYASGVPTSLQKNVGQQWDFPNGWSPIQHIIIEGMRKSDNPDAQEMAFQLAQKWVRANYRVYKETHKMWEKYDVIGNIPTPGAGGEYDVQEGFGWTNGVILDLLSTYYERMTSEKRNVTDDTKFCISSATRNVEYSWNLKIMILAVGVFLLAIIVI